MMADWVGRSSDASRVEIPQTCAASRGWRRTNSAPLRLNLEKPNSNAAAAAAAAAEAVAAGEARGCRNEDRPMLVVGAGGARQSIHSSTAAPRRIQQPRYRLYSQPPVPDHFSRPPTTGGIYTRPIRTAISLARRTKVDNIVCMYL